MDNWNLITEDKAFEIIENNLRVPRMNEIMVSTDDALGMTASKSLISKIDVPGFKRSTVDGYAVNSQDFDEETQTRWFELAFKVEMGKVPELALGKNNCAYVPTGGAMPIGADSVVMLEDSSVEGQKVKLKKVAPHENYVNENEDFSKDEILFDSGKILTCADLGKASAVGHKLVRVKEKPKVFVISTGDELETDYSMEIPPLGKVFNINLNSVITISKKFGFQIAGHEVGKDDFDSIRSTLEYAMEIADIVVFSGGSSVGEKDYVKRIIESFHGSEIHFHGIRIKPGKPTILANIGDKVIIGLPGHPASAFMIYSHFGAHIAKKCFGTYREGFKVRAILSSDLKSPRDRDTMQIVKLHENPNFMDDKEMYVATPLFGKSAVISKIAQADGYILTRVGSDDLEKGQVVYVEAFNI